ncbi:hypothetical protein KC361_g233 [Hortaea werneckii]|nr:hypothetical protein KC361_g233 [Hortaea werneckii]
MPWTSNFLDDTVQARICTLNLSCHANDLGTAATSTGHNPSIAHRRVSISGFNRRPCNATYTIRPSEVNSVVPFAVLVWSRRGYDECIEKLQKTSSTDLALLCLEAMVTFVRPLLTQDAISLLTASNFAILVILVLSYVDSPLQISLQRQCCCDRQYVTAISLFVSISPHERFNDDSNIYLTTVDIATQFRIDEMAPDRAFWTDIIAFSKSFNVLPSKLSVKSRLGTVLTYVVHFCTCPNQSKTGRGGAVSIRLLRALPCSSHYD